MTSLQEHSADDQSDAAQSRDRDVSAIVAANLKSLRRAQGYSLEKLADVSKVSRAMLGQIETGKSVPTITVLWKIADALRVPVSRLVHIDAAPAFRVLRRADNIPSEPESSAFLRRPLFEPWIAASSQLFELRFGSGHREHFEAGTAGQRHTLIVASGSLTVTFRDETPVDLGEGDALIFDSGLSYVVENTSSATAFAYWATSSC